MLKCENVSVKGLIENISFETGNGGFTAIIGKNGSGKTTLARAIMGEVKHSGKVRLCKDDICTLSQKSRAERLAYLPQMPTVADISVYELAMLGRTPYTSLLGNISDNDKAAVKNALKLTDMCGFENRRLKTLSGGETKRAFLAMLLAQETPVLLLDEPTAFMDMQAAAEFTKLLSETGKTLAVIMHDLSLVTKYATNVLVLDGGKQVFFGSMKDCLDKEIIEKTFSVRKIEKDGEIVFAV